MNIERIREFWIFGSLTEMQSVLKFAKSRNENENLHNEMVAVSWLYGPHAKLGDSTY